MTNYECRMAPLGLKFPLPTPEARRVDISEDEFMQLILQGLSALVGSAALSPSTPIPNSINVTAVATVIHVAKPSGCFVEVMNTGSVPVLILPNGTPAFSNGGSEPVDRGIRINPGDLWSSPARISSQIVAIAETGQNCSMTVIRY